ncbi:hypothetical protein BX666DRAFT_1191573 [Dichotomocladium elegans]|nr:hypothetical protein BX666DRAFT_1191573 [Dichotomocladium elegans]
MGVDAIMDMARTSINVTGNCLACCVMARTEGTFRGLEWKLEEESRRRKLASDEKGEDILPVAGDYAASLNSKHMSDVDDRVEVRVDNKDGSSIKSFDDVPNGSGHGK